MSLNILTGVGPKTIQKLHKLNIFTAIDLLYHFPSRYLDFSQVTKIAHLVLNQITTISGTIQSFSNTRTKSGKTMQKIILSDPTGHIDIIFFNQDYLKETFKIGDCYSFAGKIDNFAGRLCLISPEYGSLHTGRIIPIYPTTAGLSSKMLRRFIASLVTKMPPLLDLPTEILSTFKLDSLQTSLKSIHFPPSVSLLEKSKLELSIREILNLQINSYHQKKSWQNRKLAKQLLPNQKRYHTFLSRLPFKLTISQENAWLELKRHLFGKHPSNILLQGDVGSGKTVLAAMCLDQSLANNLNSYFVAPTQILAEQHYQTLSNFFDPKNITLISGSSKKTTNSKFPQIFITTQAVFYKKDLDLSNTGTVVIDEQHKFGVNQRSFFENSVTSPHVITMTATPIPRTVNLALLGHLDVVKLENKPKNRLPIKSHLVLSNKESDCLQWLEKHLLETKTQAFVVCPFIEDSEVMDQVTSAESVYQELSSKLKLKIQLLHSKTSQKDREKIMQDFKDNKFQILVSTPIIEVGIDIPNATCMLIYSPDRFGLAQLHQIRGRVGRGVSQSYCFLMSQKTNTRLSEFCQTEDGGKLALLDLKNRGAGEIFGTLQHGFSNLRLASTTDLDLIEKAQKILDSLEQKYPNYLQQQTTKPESSIALN